MRGDADGWGLCNEEGVGLGWGGGRGGVSRCYSNSVVEKNFKNGAAVAQDDGNRLRLRYVMGGGGGDGGFRVAESCSGGSLYCLFLSKRFGTVFLFNTEIVCA